MVKRNTRIARQKIRIEKLRGQGEGIEEQIKTALQELDEICGHPKIQQESWGHAKCMDCGLLARESFLRGFNPIVFSITGQKKA